MSALATRQPVDLVGVTKSYGPLGLQTLAVDDATLRLASGQLTLVLGPSGSGKTTLLSLMACLIRPTSGTVRLFGADVARLSPAEVQRLRARRIGFVFQTFRLLDALSALDNVAMVARFAGVGRREARRRASAELERLGLGDLGAKRPSALSQGEKQRVAIARAVVNRPDILLADEPTGSLDTERAMEVARLLRAAVDTHGCCVVVATHDDRMSDFSDHQLSMEDGRVEIRVASPATAPRLLRAPRPGSRSSPGCGCSTG